MARLEKNKWLIIVIGLSVLIRIAMTPWGYHGDILVQAGWGKWIFEHGMRGFYENNVWIYGWPNQPPLISWLYAMGFQLYAWIYTGFILGGSFVAEHHLGAGHLLWFYRLVVWWGNAKYIDTPFKIAELMTMKIWSIIGDGVLAYMIYKIVATKVNENKGRLAAVIYLISPFTWYESAIWGQHDQLGLIFLLIAFWLVASKKLVWLTPTMMTISILIKPTALIFGPLLFWISIRDKKTFVRVILGGILALAGYFLLVRAISSLDFVTFNYNLQKQMFAKGELWTWVNTFNFWRIVTGHLTNFKTLFWGVRLDVWGYLMYVGVNILAFWVSRKRDWWSVLKAIFIVGFGGWMLIVTMHERYLFTAVGVGLILAMNDRRLMKYWVVMSLIFWLNMYNGWWYPENWEWLKNILTWGSFFDSPTTKILAAINLGLMVAMTGKLIGGGDK